MSGNESMAIWLASVQNYCCAHEFLSDKKKVRTGLLAKELGIHRTTVIKYRRMLREGKFPRCSQCSKLVLVRGHK